MRDAERNGSGRGLVRQGRVGPPLRHPVRRRPVRRGLRVSLALAGAVAGISVVAACGGSSGENPVQAAMSTFTVGPPETASFSGEPPSAFASAHESALASVSAAQASASERAASFEASVNAQLAATRAKAAEVLAAVTDAGNAISDVTLTGVPNSTSGDLSAAMVTVTNSTTETRSYAIQVDFTDSTGKSVDSQAVGIENLAAGATANPMAFSKAGQGANLLPVVVKSYRY
ncbi:hypothetical protein K353_00190 [Kitasatospora sp. SolWspMP-SS2h]|uniref:hypothetical protein n=1 Tax=Kitasatospora sp. SolWspMP-SS2h TaxID=1305729 RepID=UPI000DB9749D|nr:hypothetical protein [Kitasatospora sp. SolWspMP-SS2h]RAJ46989.1 hypothetical protein K353_00190 [Kitasatospora sp. SolWspMP-SS2h]